MCGFLHRPERNKTNLVRSAHFLQRPANARITRQSLAAPSGDRSKAVMVMVIVRPHILQRYLHRGNCYLLAPSMTPDPSSAMTWGKSFDASSCPKSLQLFGMMCLTAAKDADALLPIVRRGRWAFRTRGFWRYGRNFFRADRSRISRRRQILVDGVAVSG